MVEKSTELQQGSVLVVEDEAEIREMIGLLLLRQGLNVQATHSALDARDFLQKKHFDLIVLDWMLPQMSGLEFLKLKQQTGLASGVPVLMVTAKAEPGDIVQGLEAGADDYITKPFEPNVFAARVRALLRRSPKSRGHSESNILAVGTIQMNLDSHEVTISGKIVHFTTSEFKILSELILNLGRVMTRDQLIQIVQGEGVSVTGRTIDTHVFGMRKKMSDQSELIETIRGVGYRIKSE